MKRLSRLFSQSAMWMLWLVTTWGLALCALAGRSATRRWRALDGEVQELLDCFAYQSAFVGAPFTTGAGPPNLTPELAPELAASGAAWEKISGDGVLPLRYRLTGGRDLSFAQILRMLQVLHAPFAMGRFALEALEIEPSSHLDDRCHMDLVVTARDVS